MCLEKRPAISVLSSRPDALPYTRLHSKQAQRDNVFPSKSKWSDSVIQRYGGRFTWEGKWRSRRPSEALNLED